MLILLLFCPVLVLMLLTPSVREETGKEEYASWIAWTFASTDLMRVNREQISMYFLSPFSHSIIKTNTVKWKEILQLLETLCDMSINGLSYSNASNTLITLFQLHAVYCVNACEEKKLKLEYWMNTGGRSTADQLKSSVSSFLGFIHLSYTYNNND